MIFDNPIGLRIAYYIDLALMAVKGSDVKPQSTPKNDPRVTGAHDLMEWNPALVGMSGQADEKLSLRNAVVEGA